MLKYLLVLLDDSCPSICQYENQAADSRLMPLAVLKKAIVFGMKENLMVQFLYPNKKLDNSYLSVINTIDHTNICPLPISNFADVVILENWHFSLRDLNKDKVYILRTNFADFAREHLLIKDILQRVAKLNIVIEDISRMSDEAFKEYEVILNHLAAEICELYLHNLRPQLNLLTDRLFLSKMNNCNAGVESISLAPDGRFYICPASYYCNDNPVGDLDSGISIKNQQLYQIEYAPICRICDAYHCKRCVWLNNKTTLEYNTPSHEQCVMAHIERNCSRLLSCLLKKANVEIATQEIDNIDYLDPFEIDHL